MEGPCPESGRGGGRRGDPTTSGCWGARFFPHFIFTVSLLKAAPPRPPQRPADRAERLARVPEFVAPELRAAARLPRLTEVLGAVQFPGVGPLDVYCVNTHGHLPRLFRAVGGKWTDSAPWLWHSHGRLQSTHRLFLWPRLVLSPLATHPPPPRVPPSPHPAATQPPACPSLLGKDQRSPPPAARCVSLCPLSLRAHALKWLFSHLSLLSPPSPRDRFPGPGPSTPWIYWCTVQCVHTDESLLCLGRVGLGVGDTPPGWHMSLSSPAHATRHEGQEAGWQGWRQREGTLRIRVGRLAWMRAAQTATPGEVTPTQYLGEERRTVKRRGRKPKSPRVPHGLLVINTEPEGGFFCRQLRRCVPGAPADRGETHQRRSRTPQRCPRVRSGSSAHLVRRALCAPVHHPPGPVYLFSLSEPSFRAGKYS